MQTSYRKSQHSDLPEHVPESEVAAYKFPIPDGTAPFSIIQAVPPSTSYDEDPKPNPSRRTLTTWPILILCGLLLATIAGVAGGFIGKTIEQKSHQTDTLPENQTCPTVASTSTSPTTSTLTPSATSTPSSQTFERSIAQPTTGCTSATSYNSFKARTEFLEWQYTTVCGHGWLNNELIALSAATTSDCVEACVMYNTHKSESDRTCVGGGFIPEWWNQTRAMDESGGMAYNCFLKSNASGVARNDKKYEVVALCLDAWCDDVLG
ncbi:hypothetical protein E8E11_000477 [Didymella keratinophila]|nr:hypothetical protein E8E11_000477 [Didymella keratinophila]